jgi:hypothetical protein
MKTEFKINEEHCKKVIERIRLINGIEQTKIFVNPFLIARLENEKAMHNIVNYRRR